MTDDAALDALETRLRDPLNWRLDEVGDEAADALASLRAELAAMREDHRYPLDALRARDAVIREAWNEVLRIRGEIVDREYPGAAREFKSQGFDALAAILSRASQGTAEPGVTDLAIAEVGWDSARDSIRRVHELHAPFIPLPGIGPDPSCRECREPHPCRTVRALEGIE